MPGYRFVQPKQASDDRASARSFVVGGASEPAGSLGLTQPTRTEMRRLERSGVAYLVELAGREPAIFWTTLDRCFVRRLRLAERTS